MATRLMVRRQKSRSLVNSRKIKLKLKKKRWKLRNLKNLIRSQSLNRNHSQSRIQSQFQRRIHCQTSRKIPSVLMTKTNQKINSQKKRNRLPGRLSLRLP